MMKNIINLLIVVLLLSCNNNNTTKKDYAVADIIEKESVNKNSDAKETEEILNISAPFYKTSMQSDSTFICLYSNLKHMSFMYAQPEVYVYASKCKISNNHVDTIKTILLYGDEDTYFVPDTASYLLTPVEDKQFLYFSYLDGYPGAGSLEYNVNFTLIDYNNLEDYQLRYIGEINNFKCDGCVDGSFQESEKLNNHPHILNKLKELSRASQHIYQRTEKDEDIYYHLNFETKWNADNNANNSYGAGRATIELPIKSTYYRTNLFELLGMTGDDDTGQYTVENDQYLIKTAFRYSVIGYDKTKDLYFPVVVERCFSDCNKNLEWIDDNVLRISYNEYSEEHYDINMDEILFDGAIGD